MLKEFNALVLRSNGTFNGKRTNDEWFLKSNNKQYLDWFNETTKDLLPFYGFRERLVLLNNNYYTPPLCKNCDLPVRVDQKIIHEFCSVKCSANSPDIMQKRFNTFQKIYGVAHPMHNTNVKNKIKQNNLEKYGVEYTLQSHVIRNKIKVTVKQKYGVEHPMQNLEIKEKAKNTFFNKYLDDPEKKQELKEKRYATCLSRYNRKSNSQLLLSDDTISKLEDKEWLLAEYETKSSVEIADNLNCYYGTVIKYLRSYGAEIKKSRNCSRFENWIIEFLNNNNIKDIEVKNRKILQGKEIDILLPKYNLGIEIDGLYWHSDVDKNYHQNKTLLAKKQGIFLIHITDNDLLFRKEMVHNIILGKLNLLKTIYARNTVVKDVSPKEANDFLRKNHLQGAGKAKIRLGLYYENQLIQLTTFDTPRFNKNYQWELIRSASLQGLTIVGGFSKLIKHFRKTNTGSIVSYVDMQYFNGNSYESTGWTKVGITSPGYVWVKGNLIVSRYKAQKKNLSKLLNNYDKTKSEKENMEQEGFIRYWNCGNLIYHLL